MTIELTLRAEKGSPLTIAEGDGNLVALRDAILALTGMTVVGWTQDPITGALTLEFSNGQLVGPLQLGTRPIRPRGDWTDGIDYLPGDFVTHGGSSYLAVLPHEAPDLEADLDAGRWQLLAAGAPGYVPRGDYNLELAHSRGDGVYFVHETGARSLYVALDDIAVGEAPEEPGSNWGVLASTGGGTGGGGGGGAVILVERFEKAGPISAGLIGHMVIPAPCSLVPDAFHWALLGTAPGSSSSCAVNVLKNGEQVFSIVLNGTQDMNYGPGEASFQPGDILRVETSTFSTFGAAADLSVTLTLSAGI